MTRAGSLPLLMPVLLLAGAALARPDAPSARQAAHQAAHEAAKTSLPLPGFESRTIEILESFMPEIPDSTISAIADAEVGSRYDALTDEDFRIIAEELGVEIAAIKAVVEIEAGAQMKGFWAPGVPVVNFDRSMYNRFRSKGSPIKDKQELTVPKGLKGYALKEWTELVNARKAAGTGADLGTFWGMFQIGGFNYRSCGCESISEFVERMSDSEFEQLELFANFITKAGMVADLKAKNWAAFARKYNGASYARQGYHTKMARAYAKHKK